MEYIILNIFIVNNFSNKASYFKILFYSNSMYLDNKDFQD